jgi:hypothetical protein
VKVDYGGALFSWLSIVIQKMRHDAATNIAISLTGYLVGTR